MKLSRRQVLAGGAAFALAPSLARAAPPDLDVAIIGGGVSGAYAAWRLRQEKPHLRIHLFEASERIGGRLHSIAFPEAPHLVAEIGGMRFLEAHAHVFGLVENLLLPKRLYPIDRDANRVMLRGRNFSRKDVYAGRARFPYRVPDKDQSADADYFGRAIENILPGATHMGPADWRKLRGGYRFKGRRLADWKNRDLLRAAGMSAEELALAEDSSGYDDWIEGETGLDEMDYFFVHDDESKPFYTLAGGYQRLPLTLAAQAQRNGASISLHTRLVSLVAEPGRFRLALRDASGRQSEVSAARVVLALPRRGIEGIANFPDAKTNARFASLIASVRPIPACKSLLLYKRPWWRDHGILEGRSVTDLPARQFYCLGSETTRLPSEDTNGYGVLMAYCDMKSVATWRRLAGNADAGFVSLAGDSVLAREVHRESTLVLGKTALKPIAARFQDWSASPFGGGWHYYALGHDGLADSAAMLKPIPERDLFVCGEAYSTSQGWVEGALERAEAMLQRHFGLHRPDWLRA
ncbi:MAG: FAD-dependent oxidoreductase [Proteobacteria bacterium]|nr:FAD-dependent oxidoreductase [Pseudomonadota bacterium]